MRKLGLLTTLWTALLFFPLSSFALGLGEIEVSTFLNQPLKAEIEVLSARQGEVDDLLVSLASREAFRKAGLQRSSNLSKLRFKVEKSEDGQSARILISTKTPVKEPFLNFLVEADWAKGRLLREFTILLDPPYFSQQAQTPVSTASSPPDVAAVAPAETSMSTRMEEATMPEDTTMQMETESQQATDEPLNQPIALSDEAMSDDRAASEDSTPYVADSTYRDSGTNDSEIRVEKGDTLWAIASQFKDDEHSMGQVMLAMQAMNPEAFGQDNINNLKVGAILRAPDMDALDRLTKQEAYAQVLQQNGLWDEYVARKSGATMAGSPEAATSMEPQSDQQDTESQLSLLAPGDGESTSASLQNDANSEDAGQIRKQLALAEEELEASRLENDDLKSRVSDLEQQLAKLEELQNLVQIEDSSLAQLQESVSESQSESDAFIAEPDQEAVQDTLQQEMVTELQEQPASEAEVQPPTDVMIEAADQMMSEQTDDQMMADTDVDQTVSETETDKGFAETEPLAEADAVIESDEQADTAAFASEGPNQEQEQQQKDFVPAPVIVTEAPSTAMDGGIMDMLPSLDSIFADPVMLGGIGAILALLLGFVFIKRKKADSEEESGILLDDDDLLDDDATPIHVPTAEDAEAAIDEESLGILDTEQHMADTMAVEASDISDAPDEEEDPFGSTEIVAVEELPTPDEHVAEEQDDVLNEVDVYLAYGLYDNAEDLLKESLQENPDRADYRAKLLDTYFATKNASGFTQEAEALKSLGGAANRYWDRVQIMGFELAPDNDLFADARDSDLSVADLEYAKPDTPDFDIGAEDDITDFSSTDFDLGSDSDTFDVTSDLLGDVDQELTDTEIVAPIGDAGTESDDTDLDSDIELPGLNDEDETLLREEEIARTENVDLPDQIGDFDLDQGDKDDSSDEDALNFDLPEDLDLSVDMDDNLAPLEPTENIESMDEAPPLDEDGVEIDIESSDLLEVDFGQLEEGSTDSGEESQTMVMAPDLESESPSEVTTDDEIRDKDAALDMDMSDLESAELNTGNFKPLGDETIEISDEITEFRPADITGEFSAFDSDSAEDVDIMAGLEKTGTYAPGDFNEDDLDNLVGSSSEPDDISDLMLPDDVDEVGTKLDLAKAFIDMGDAEGARSSLEEVLLEGTAEQKAEATNLMEKI